MAQNRYIAGLADNPEEQLLLRKLSDRLHRFRTRGTPEITHFLSPREQALCRQLLQAEGVQDVRFWGGFPEAERRLLFLLPDWLGEDWLTGTESPLAAVRCRFPGAALTHRDLLGALMATGLKREAVGDILVSAEQADFLVLRKILPFLHADLERAGRARLRLEEIALSQLQPPVQQTEIQRATVAALRADCVLAAALYLSRARAGELIRQCLVRVDDLTLTKGDRLLQAGQVVSVRGYGKFRLQEIGGQTRKGRTAVVFAQYR